MSMVESSSDAQTLIDPVIIPVTILSAIRNAATAIDKRAVETFVRFSSSADSVI
jgi:hypothetical protein